MAIEIRANDQVRLNAGGELMTVLDIGRQTGIVVCRWKKGTGEPCVSAYPAACLTLVKASAES